MNRYKDTTASNTRTPTYKYQNHTQGSYTTKTASGIYCECGAKMHRDMLGIYRCPVCDDFSYNLPYDVLADEV